MALKVSSEEDRREITAREGRVWQQCDYSFGEQCSHYAQRGTRISVVAYPWIGQWRTFLSWLSHPRLFVPDDKKVYIPRLICKRTAGETRAYSHAADFCSTKRFLPQLNWFERLHASRIQRRHNFRPRIQFDQRKVHLFLIVNTTISHVSLLLYRFSFFAIFNFQSFATSNSLDCKNRNFRRSQFSFNRHFAHAQFIHSLNMHTNNINDNKKMIAEELSYVLCKVRATPMAI